MAKYILLLMTVFSQTALAGKETSVYELLFNSSAFIDERVSVKGYGYVNDGLLYVFPTKEDALMHNKSIMVMAVVGRDSAVMDHQSKCHKGYMKVTGNFGYLKTHEKNGFLSVDSITHYTLKPTIAVPSTCSV